jgi:hypothetical protein
MVGEGVEHPAKQVGGRLVTGNQQMNSDEEELFVGQAAVGVMFEQPTQHGAGPLQPAGGELLQEVAA